MKNSFTSQLLKQVYLFFLRVFGYLAHIADDTVPLTIISNVSISGAYRGAPLLGT
jgi:hypothetical protein